MPPEPWIHVLQDQLALASHTWDDMYLLAICKSQQSDWSLLLSNALHHTRSDSDALQGKARLACFVLTGAWYVQGSQTKSVKISSKTTQMLEFNAVSNLSLAHYLCLFSLFRSTQVYLNTFTSTFSSPSMVASSPRIASTRFFWACTKISTMGCLPTVQPSRRAASDTYSAA